MINEETYWAWNKKPYAKVCARYEQYFDQKMNIWQKQPPRGVLEKVFPKYAANLQENTHAEVRFQ